MRRLLLLVLTVLSASMPGCRTVSSNLPDRMTQQIQEDWRCDEMTGRLVGRAPRTETWRVDACGRRLVITCPHGAHSRWRPCHYDDEDVGSENGYVRVAAPAPSPAPAAAPEPLPPSADAAEAQARAQLDQRAAAILACNGGEVVAVDVTWDAAATVQIGVVAPLAGSPVEGCMRDAIGELVLPVGAAGSIRHVIDG